MPRPSLLTQALLANLMLVAVAVIGAVLVTNPDYLADRDESVFAVLGLLLALTVAVNVWLLQRRFEPLEDLIGQMEDTSLLGPRPPRPPRGVPAASEVKRLEGAFHRMIERLEDERRRAGRAGLEAQERERARVARDLHDEVNQALTGILLHLEAAREKAPPELVEELAETKAFADQAMDELLGLARQLRPTTLDDLGLRAALGGLVTEARRASGLDASLETDPTLDAIDPDVQLVVYRVCQEAVTNAVQHSDASSLRIVVRRGAGAIEAWVVDDGSGFDDATLEGLGIAGMRERALLVDAAVIVDSAAGDGTTVYLRIPEPSVQPVTEISDETLVPVGG